MAINKGVLIHNLEFPQPFVEPTTLYTWGSNAQGQLGDGTTVNRSSPVSIGTLNWSKISIGDQHAAAIRRDGTLWSWGDNTFGQLGTGNTISRSSPIQVGTDNSWILVASGLNHTMAIRSDGRLFTWGRNNQGQLGDNTTTNRSSPVSIGTSSWTFISAGHEFSTGIRLDGRALAWGRNNVGQLASFTITNISTPTTIGSFESFYHISAGSSHVVAITTEERVMAWGWNSSGQLGDGTTVNKSAPTFISALGYAILGAAGANSSYIIRSQTSRLEAWGNNSTGQLGLNDTVNRSSPVQVGTSSWVMINAGTAIFAQDPNAKLFAWGDNSTGRLGLNDTINRSSPVQVGTDSWRIGDMGTYSGGIRGSVVDNEEPLKALFTIDVLDVYTAFWNTLSASAFAGLSFLTFYNPSSTQSVIVQGLQRGSIGGFLTLPPINPPTFTAVNPTFFDTVCGSPTFPLTLAPGESRTVTVGFTPSGPGQTGNTHFAIASRASTATVNRLTRVRLTGKTTSTTSSVANSTSYVAPTTPASSPGAPISGFIPAQTPPVFLNTVSLEGNGIQVQPTTCFSGSFGYAGGTATFNGEPAVSLCTGFNFRLNSSTPGQKCAIARINGISILILGNVT